MSFKTTAQLILLLIIGLILGFVYYNYFYLKNDVQQVTKDYIEEKITEEKKTEEKITEEKITEEKKTEEKITEEKITEEKNLNIKKDENESENNINNKNISKKSNAEQKDIDQENSKIEKKTEEDVSNILKEVEYLTIDNKGNKYNIFANSGVTSKINKDILELDKVRGIITSDTRSTIYIVSDYAKYNSSNQNSHFYQNVVINFEDKQIDCDFFDVNMQTNLSIAYGNVVVTDPKSIMKAGKITLDMETKDINIEPGAKKKVKIETE